MFFCFPEEVFSAGLFSELDSILSSNHYYHRSDNPALPSLDSSSWEPDKLPNDHYSQNFLNPVNNLFGVVIGGMDK